MLVEMADAVSSLESWTTGKAVIVRGAQGGGFCAGGDLDFVRRIVSPQMGFNMSTLMTDTLTRLHKLPLLTLSYIEGSGKTEHSSFPRR